MNIPELYTNVIDGLLTKSRKNEVVWNATTDSNTFVVYFNSFSLSIRKNSDNNFNNSHEEWVTVELINNNGEKIDSFFVEEGDDNWQVINELFALSRRSALSIDTAIKEMLNEINKKEIIGKKNPSNNNSTKKGDFIDDIPF